MAKAVLVTTKHRGVFFGHVKADDKAPAEIILSGARNCLYWDRSIGGFLGLASKGPNGECKIGTQVPELKLYEITSITPCTDNAVKAWESA